MNTYDWVIVGAGSSGCVLAERLSRDPHASVLLIEAGPRDTSMMIHIPRGVIEVCMPNTRFVSTYEVQKGGNRGTDLWPKGRVLGGSSSVNGMIYARGFPQDYDEWEAAGCTGWGWKDLGPCFKAMEGHELGETETRGGSGPLKVGVQRTVSPLMRQVMDAAVQTGVPYVKDVNEAPEGGVGLQTATIHRGRRMSAARAFLRPAQKRKNLTVVTDTTVQRLVFEGTKAARVQLRDRSGVREVGVGREVILAAGALESPKLLQLSGVGDAAHLKALGVPVVADSPNVGRNLREHVLVPLRYRVTGGCFANEFRGLRLPFNALRFLLTGTGPLTHAAHEVIAFVKSRPEYDRADGELGVMFAGVGEKASGAAYLEAGSNVTVISYYGRPTSQGYCLIQSADPDRPMSINANFLETEEDRRHSIDLVKCIHRMMMQPALEGVKPRYVGPNSNTNFDSDDEVLDLIYLMGTGGRHVAGTLRMGPDAAAPVDLETRVRGVQGVRVVDTSIMPGLPTANTNGPAMAMAWRAADLITQ